MFSLYFFHLKRLWLVHILERIDRASGRMHEHATGARMSVSDLPRFRERVEGMVGKG